MASTGWALRAFLLDFWVNVSESRGEGKSKDNKEREMAGSNRAGVCLLFLIFLSACLMSRSAQATLIYKASESREFETLFDYYWQWTPQGTESISKTGSWWTGNTSVTFDTGLNTWTVAAGGAHLFGVTGHNGEGSGTAVGFSCLPSFGPNQFGVNLCVGGSSVGHGAHRDFFGLELSRVAGHPDQNRIHLFGAHTPEPSTALLLGMGLVGLTAAGRMYR